VIDLPIDPALQLALRGAAALLFLSAAIHKLRDRHAFERALEGYDLLPRAASTPVAAVLIAFELLLGALCLVPAGSAGACLVGAGLLGLYSAAIAIRLANGGAAIDCGCGGPGGERSLRGDLLLRNAVLIVLLGIASLPPDSRPLVWIDAITIVGTGLLLAGVYAAYDIAAANAAQLHAQAARG
jgi:hypothetical protein